MGKLFRRIYYLLNIRRLNRELEEEMAAHRAMMPEDRQARFGSTTRLRELSAERWGGMWLNDLRRDLAYGAFSLSRSPGFTVAAVLVLALGIGVNLAEFQILNAVFHRLRVRDMNTLARFSRGPGGHSRNQFAPEAIAFYREYNSSFSSIFEETDARDELTLEGDPQPLRASFVSGDYFGTLGVLPTYGRLLDKEDCKPGAAAVTVLGYGYWQARFGSDSAIVGQKIRLNGKPVQVVGVGPSNFSGVALVRTFLWLPNILQPYLTRTGSNGAETSFAPALFGRLKPKVTFEAAESEFRALAAELQKQRPKLFQRGEQIRVERIDALNDPVIAVIVSYWILLVMLVLFAACANLGNMLLARGLARQREIEIRLAIGAGPSRIIRQLMTENLLLACIGTVGALAVGRFAAQILNNIVSQPDIRLGTDWRLLPAAVILTLIAVSAFGLAPAIQTVVGRGRPTARAGKFLVSFQVAISCALLIISSLLTREMLLNLGSGVSIDYTHMIVADPALYLQGEDAPRDRQSLDDSVSRVRRLPGVDGVTLASIPPFGRRTLIEKLPGSSQLLYLNAVDSSYFGILRLRFLTGRPFLPAEQDAVIVSQSAARALWPAQEPLGKSLDLFGHRRTTVVGVVADSGVSSVVVPTSVEAYVPLDDQSITHAVLLVHTTAKPNLLSGVIRAAASTEDRVALVSSMDDDLAKHLEGSRNLLVVIGALGIAATALAAVGIFGLIAFTVSQRTKEIGVRLALGASRSRILGTVLGQYVTPISSGLLAGVVIATAGRSVLQSTLGEVPRFDPISHAAVLLGFLVIAFAAAILPCRKALEIDPASVLRGE